MEYYSDGQKLFDGYLAARVPIDDPEGLLEALLAHAQPVLKRTVRSRLGSLYTAADASELASEAMLELLRRLRALYNAAVPVKFPFEALAAGVAANTVHRFYARRFPERNRLRKRLRYLLETGDRFRLWLGKDGAAVCGLAHASENEPVSTAADVERCIARLREKPVPAHPLSLLVFEILRALTRPIELSRLTAVTADCIGIQEPTWIPSATDSDEHGAQFPADPALSVALRLELRERVESLWPEVLLLPARQRVALLLSARTPNGAAAWLLVDLGVASFREVAAALELTAEQLCEWWNRLPLGDREIAAILGLERQQVINLRASARERLARRELSRSPIPIEGRNRS